MNVQQQPQLLIPKMAQRFGLERENFEAVMKNVIMPPNATNAETVAFLAICDRYGLDPFLKHIHCFFDKRTDRIMPIISIDGWSFMVNAQPQFDGCEFEYTQDDNGQVVAITCRMFRKDRTRPTTITEFLSECWRNTDAWKQTPARMLRHRSFMQCARICFGFSGLDEDQMIELSGETIEAQAYQPDAQRQPAAPRPPSPKRKPAAIEDNAQAPMDRIRTDEQQAFDKVETQQQQQAETVKPKRAPKSTEKPTQSVSEENRTTTPANAQNALDAFAVALADVNSAEGLDELLSETDIRAALTHDADKTELLEAMIAKAKRRLAN